MLLGSRMSKKESGQRLLSGYRGGAYIHTYVLRNGAGVICLGGGVSCRRVSILPSDWTNCYYTVCSTTDDMMIW